MFFIFLLTASLEYFKSDSRVLKSQSQEYERITYEASTGKFINEKYISTHTIPESDFTATSSGDKEGHSLNNIFDNTDNDWVSQNPNSATFHSYIDISFKKQENLESFLISGKIMDYDNNGNNDYHGFPTKIKVYTSSNNEQRTLHTIFVGSPVHPMTEAQFVFSDPVQCDQIRIEFTEVTEDKVYSNGDHTCVIKTLKLIKSFGYDDVEFSIPKEPYDTEYTKLHTVPQSQFTYDSTGDKEGYPIKNAFDSDLKSNWISKEANSDTFHSSIYINFSEPLLLEGFSIGGKYSDSTYQRTYYGFPTKLNFYIGNEDGSFKLHSKFTGDLSQGVYDFIDYFQFILLQPVRCDKIQLEFYEVTTESSGKKTAAVSDIFLLKNIDDETIKIEKATGNYANDDIVNHKSIHVKSYSSNGDKEGNEIGNAFDNNKESIWISSIENNENDHSYILAEFEKPVLLEAFLFDSYIKRVTGNSYIVGFPLKLNLYTSLNNDDYSLNSVFVGTPESSMDRTQFVLKNPVNCTKVKLEFVEIKQEDKVAGTETAACANLIFIQSLSYQYLKFTQSSSGFDDSHQLTDSQFNYSSSGDQDDDHSIQKAFDGESTTAWFSKNPNSNDFFNYIEINFHNPVLLECFLFTPYRYKKSVNALITNYYICGFPRELELYSSLNGEDFKLSATFSGTLSQDKDSGPFLFKLDTPISCTKIRLQFKNILTHVYLNNNAQTAAISNVKLIAQDFSIKNEINDNDKDLSTYHVNDQFPPSSASNLEFIDYTLPKGDEYLFNIEKKFDLNEITFQPSMNIGAIKCVLSNQVNIEQCKFQSCSVRKENGNGGAVYILNSGLKCSSSTFIKCLSDKGGNGGGLFIVLNQNLEKEVTIDECTFTQCSAVFGGGIYAFSEIKSNSVKVSDCTFKSNLISDKNKINGGSAIYAKITNGLIIRCKFSSNAGKGSITFDNDFKNAVTPIFLNEKPSLVLIKDCIFEIDHSSSSIYYLGSENEEAFVKVLNCVFVGDLKLGSHHIFVDSLSKKISDKPKLSIKSCKFSSDENKSINFNSLSSVSFDVKNQVFNYIEGGNKNINKRYSFNIKGISLVLESSLFIIAALVIAVVVVKKRFYNSNEDMDSNDKVDL